MPTDKFGFSYEAFNHQIYVRYNDASETILLTIEDTGNIEMTANDLELFGQMCIDLSEKMKRDHELRNACPECGGILAHHEYCSMYVRKN